MGENGEDSSDDRLDKWLWCTRFYRTRALAAAAIKGGKVHLNGERVKPAHRLRSGDRVSVFLQGVVADFDVLRPAKRRGPPAEAQSHYLETPPSALRRAQMAEQHRLAAHSRPRPDVKPDKRDRRRLMRLQRGQT